MSPDVKKIVLGAIVGALSAFAVDLDAWQKVRRAHDPKARFDWGLAASRWLRGAIIGAVAGAGVSAG